MKEGGKWFVIENKSDSKYLLDEISITIKLKENFPRQAFTNFCKSLNILIERENELGHIDLKLPESANVFGIYSQLKSSAMFEWIDINSYGLRSGYDPNDSGYSYQYFLDNSSGYPNIDINDVWEYLVTEDIDLDGVTVAVLDEGVKYDLPDIDANMWQNGQNSYGYDFVGNDDDPLPLPNNHHGTQVAGIIAAETNNNNGIASVAGGWYNSIAGAKIMAVRIMLDGWISSSLVDDAILYAANNGADIINMSFNMDDLTAVRGAIDYAYKKKGCLLVAASGNKTGEGIDFPANYYSVMAVAGILKDGSNFGRNGSDLDLVAPAQDIYTLNNSGAGAVSGTSEAAPQVAGAAALIWAAYPSLTQIDVRKIINQSAYDKGTFGFDNTWGWGLLDVHNCFYELIENGDILAAPQNLTLTIVSNKAKLSWNTVSPGITKYKIYRSWSNGGRYGFTEVAEVNHPTNNWTDNSMTVTTNPPTGVYVYYRVTAVKNNGKESIMSNEVSIGYHGFLKNAANEKLTFSNQLYSNYPNPFNPSTTITYQLASESNVVLKVFDVLGREVAELVNEKQNAGNHKITFNAENLASGIYIYRMKAGNFTANQKMLFIK